MDVHIGVWPPDRWDEIDHIRANANPDAWRGRERPIITSEPIDWEALRLIPRWIGDDSSQAVAAFEPSRFHDNGAQEWDRFLAGAVSRGEIALAVSTLRSAGQPRSALARTGASVMMPGADASSIGGEQISLATPPSLVPGLAGADRDLALRISNSRPTDLPWWSLHLSDWDLQRGDGYPHQGLGEGQIQPLLTSTAGEVVAAVWISSNEDIRHYIVPFMPSYVPLLEWLADQAVPQFVPTAARRLRGSLSDEPLFQTTAEASARKALQDFEAETARQRAALQATLDEATEQGNALRDPLLYCTGVPLVRAVAEVLTDAGLHVTDLDEILGDTVNADLLVSHAGRRVLVEVKGASGNPSERLAESPARHLSTWPALRPELSVEGVVLFLNYQTKTHPLDRDDQPYRRPEFVASLTFPILGTRQLWDWWRTGDFGSIRAAVMARHGDHTGGGQQSS